MAFLRIMVLIWADMLATYVTWIMQKYLSDVWKIGFTHAAGIMNVYNGLAKCVPLFLFSFVDCGVDNFWILLFSSIAFSTGLGFLSMSTPPVLHKATHTCNEYQPNCIGHTQKALFYSGLALVAVGISGHIVSLVTFALDQLERRSVPVHDTTSDRRRNNMGLVIQLARMRRNKGKNDVNFMKEYEDPPPPPPVAENRRQQPNDTLEEDLLKLQFQPLEAMLELVNRQKERNGGSISDLRILGFIFVLIVSVGVLIGLPYVKPWKLRFGIPAICTLVATLVFSLCFCGYKDSKLRYSDRAVIRLRTHRKERQVLIRMLPIWFTCIICGVVTAIGNTYFVEQANHMNYKVGILKFPDSILLLLYGTAKTVFKRVYDRISNWLGEASQKKYAPAFGIALATIFSASCCIVASIIETRRIHVIRSHGLVDKPDEDIPMTVFWLVPQFVLLGGLDAFYENSVAPFLNDQSPPSMKKYLVYLNPGLSGLGAIGSVLSVYVVGEISKKGGKKSWFQHDLNQSRLDHYYWVLAGLSGAILIWFFLTAICIPFPYRDPVSSDTQETTDNQDKNVDQMNKNDEFINSLIKENQDIL
ncbi:protein NRT1/ PTR FAMILY 5.5-like [Coffea eugenioides]|uniref:protein NRT1/ PTR FAMILY 5.5-like n=1 Tax=Coffea eugenioides TaxID=49369 RepID=UPI000F60E460|nr:protein NRT1/ PTR FAMILY 5.5-like [Coffea eugenioides]